MINRLFVSSLVLLIGACTPKPSPDPAIKDGDEPVLASPKATESPAKLLKKKQAKPLAPKLDCPAGTEQKQNHIGKGTEHYCANESGKTGPAILTNKAGESLVEREYQENVSKGNFTFFHEGKALASGTFKDGWLDTLVYAKDAPLLHRGPDFALIESQLYRAGACKTDADCTSQYGKCPLGCDLVFNKVHQAKVQKWLSAFKGNCQYQCKPQTGALKCEHNQCVRAPH